MSLIDKVLSRRGFLVGSAGATLALPFLPSLMSRGRADGSGGACPKRAIFVFTANGQREEHWLPAPRSDWNVVDAAANVREVDLTAGTGPISTIMAEPFDALRSKLLILRGLDNMRFNLGGHEVPGMLSGWARNKDDPDYRSSITIDRVLARSSAVYPFEPPARSVHMLTKPRNMSPTSISQILDAGGAVQRVPHRESVEALYDDLFGTFVEMGDPLAEARRGLRVRTVDRIRQQYEGLRDHSRISSEDRRRLTSHIEHLNAVEARLGATSGAACTLPSRPSDLDLMDEMNLPQTTRDAIDTIVAGIRCDRTRVVTLMLCGGSDIRSSAYLPTGSTSTNHHTLSHDAKYQEGPRAELGLVNRWYGDQVAYLLSQLDVEEDPATGATYLDNTLVYWGNEDGCNRGDAHWTNNMPVMLAGGLSGHFRTGRYIDYRAVTGP